MVLAMSTTNRACVPEQMASMKIKALKTIITQNSVPSWGVALTAVKKLW